MTRDPSPSVGVGADASASASADTVESRRAGAPTYTAFAGFDRIARGTLWDVADAIKDRESSIAQSVLVYSDENGKLVDLDPRMTRPPASDSQATGDAGDAGDDNATMQHSPPARRRGRPTLGVVGREVTLLPRHWEWLNAQPGGPSVMLRKLVDEARRSTMQQVRRRDAQTRAYHFMSSIGGDLAGFEEAARALFARDRERFITLIANWPADVASHATWLAFDIEKSDESPSTAP